MGGQSMWESFWAFNENAMSNLAYVCTKNGWFFILVACAILTIALNCKAELDITVQEEQDIL